MNQTTFWIDGMTCQHCEQSVQKALSSVQGVQQAEVNFLEKRAILRHSDTFDPVQAVQAVEQAGYKAGIVS